MTGIIGIGVGAGLVSALLTLVIATGSPLALLLFFLAPLPIAIAALGWNHKAGLVGAAMGAIALGLAPLFFGGGVNLYMAVVHALSTSLPAWWFSFLALLARPGASPSEQAEWYPPGRILTWIAGVAAALTVVGVATIATDYDTYVRVFGRAVDILERINPGLFDRLPVDDRQPARAEIARMLAGLAPPVSAALSVFVSAALLVIAGRIVLASGRLPRPWPHLPATTLPKILLPIMAAAFVGSFMGGFTGLSLRTVFAALFAAYALQGLALIHALTAGAAGKYAILSSVYVVSALFGGWPLVLVALGGVADALFDIRVRRGLAASPGA